MSNFSFYWLTTQEFISHCTAHKFGGCGQGLPPRCLSRVQSGRVPRDHVPGWHQASASRKVEARTPKGTISTISALDCIGTLVDTCLPLVCIWQVLATMGTKHLESEDELLAEAEDVVR